MRRPLFFFGGILGLGILCSLLFPSLPALAGPEDYQNLQYDVVNGVATPRNPPPDGSASFTLGPGIANFTIYFGTKTIPFQAPPPLVGTLNCPLDAVVLSGGVMRYYRFEAGEGQGMGQFNILANGCAAMLKLKAGYGGIGGVAILPANEDEEEEEPKKIDACEDISILGGLACAPLTGAAGLIQGLYNGVISYARFGLYEPAKGDQIGKAGVNEETYGKLKQTWQVFARMASVLVVAAFLAMIIGSSVSGRS